MSTRRVLDADGNLWDLVAVELRRLRETHNMSLADVGALVNRDRTAVAHVENGSSHLQEQHATKLDAHWGLNLLLTRLVRFAKAGHDKSWFQTHLAMEAVATELRIWELAWMPGIVQTENYMRAILNATAVEDVDKWLQRRMERQKMLARSPWPLIWIFLDQGVLDQPVGGPGVMREQLEVLLDLAVRPNITIRVIPRSVGAHVGRDGSFKIMTVGGRDIAYTEASDGGRLDQEVEGVRSFQLRFARIGDRALDVDASIRLIRETMDGYVRDLAQGEP